MTLGQVYELLAGARTEIARLVTSGDPVLIEDLSKDPSPGLMGGRVWISRGHTHSRLCPYDRRRR